MSFADAFSVQKSSDAPNCEAGNFFKRVKWSPDGNLLLTNGEDAILRVFSKDLELQTSLHSAMDTLHDIDWYPWMQANNADSCCFISCGREQPVILWDSLCTNTRRATYLVYDHLDQLATSYSCQFAPDGIRLVAGSMRSIHSFDLSRPGRATSIIPTAEDRKDRFGQTGIISTLQFRKDSSCLLAAGSFDGTIGLYDFRQSKTEVRLMTLNKESKRDGAVTQLSFSADGWSLYSAHRKHSMIEKWDLRTGNVAYSLGPRDDQTNQRIYLDTQSFDGIEYVVSGDTKGKIHFLSENNAEIWQSPVNEIISSVSIHDTNLAFTTGGRRFKYYSSDSDEESPADIYHSSSLKSPRSKGSIGSFGNLHVSVVNKSH